MSKTHRVEDYRAAIDSLEEAAEELNRAIDLLPADFVAPTDLNGLVNQIVLTAERADAEQTLVAVNWGEIGLLVETLRADADTAHRRSKLSYDNLDHPDAEKAEEMVEELGQAFDHAENAEVIVEKFRDTYGEGA